MAKALKLYDVFNLVDCRWCNRKIGEPCVASVVIPAHGNQPPTFKEIPHLLRQQDAVKLVFGLKDEHVLDSFVFDVNRIVCLGCTPEDELSASDNVLTGFCVDCQENQREAARRAAFSIRKNSLNDIVKAKRSFFLLELAQITSPPEFREDLQRIRRHKDDK